MKAKIMKIVASTGAGLTAVAVPALAAYNATYTPADMPSVATDVIGTAGVEFKTYMPLIILVMIVVFALGRWAYIKKLSK